MAKYIVQVVVLGCQVVGRAFARALQQEYAATRAAAAKGGESRSSVNANLKMGMTLQEAKDILNVSQLDAEEIKKSYEHLFQMNDRSKGGSLYLQSKGTLAHNRILIPHLGYVRSHHRSYSQAIPSDVFSENSKENFIKRLSQVETIPYNKRKSTQEASVLVPLCLVNNEPSVLFTVRSASMGRNKGDVSFPGGMRELSDTDATHVALRETEEEIGISVNAAHIWTVMTPCPNAMGSISVTPVVAFLGNVNIDDCQINTDEVEAVFTQTLESLCNLDHWRYTCYKGGYILPVYVKRDRHIWGLTAVVLHILLQALLPGIYKNKLNYRIKKYKR